MTAILRPLRTEAETALIEAARRHVVAPAPIWLKRRRAEALAAFEAAGLPDRRVESFHYTDLRSALRSVAVPTGARTSGLQESAKALARRLGAVLLPSGADATDATALPTGVGVTNLQFEGDMDDEIDWTKRGRGGAVSALNFALARHEPSIKIAAGATPPPLLLAAGDGHCAHARTRLALGAGAKAVLIEVAEGDQGDESLGTEELDLALAPGAILTHVRFVKAGGAATLLSRATASVAADAHYEFMLVGLTGRLVRHETEIALQGRGAHASMRAALLASGERHLDLTSRITHEAAEATSQQDVRAIALGEGRAVVQGAVRVAPDAQKTDARQMIRGLLLSPRAEMNAKPELEILADDVKCSHGTAIGELDGDALFYLRARGIAKAEARRLLTEAFLAALFETVPQGALRDFISEEAAQWLGREFAGGANA